MGNTFPETYAEFEIVAREADDLALRLAADMHNTVCQTRRLIAGSRELMTKVDLAMVRDRGIVDQAQSPLTSPAANVSRRQIIRS